MTASAAAVAWLVTCEHAGRRVPTRLVPLFVGHAATLTSHRGWDPGAIGLARTLARRLGAPMVATHVTRLVVDANRTESHPSAFSEFTCSLSDAERERLLRRLHRPHRARVLAALRSLAGRPVVHLAAHSFTPVFDGSVRDVDVGFLYDPERALERRLVDRWVALLRARRPDLRVRRNAPYRGTSDGLTTTLRRTLPDTRYAGIEVEVNQAIVAGPRAAWMRLRADLANVFPAGSAAAD